MSEDLLNRKIEIAWFNVPSHPFTPKFFLFDQRGQECLHIYLWILKDLAWMQALGGWYFCGFICGALAIFWSFVLCVKALFITKNYHEAYLNIGQAIWLLGNYVWMSGELYDYNYSDDDGELLYQERSIIAGHILLAAFLYLLLFFLILKPLNIIPKPTEESMRIYETEGLAHKNMRWIFRYWREYENMHILFWCGKDLSWNTNQAPTYWFFAVLTLLESMDFSITTLFHTETIIDHAHYSATFFWVLGNVIWAAGELHAPDVDYPWPLFPAIESSVAYITPRWWASWMLILGLIPILILYFIWWELCYCKPYRHTKKDEEEAIPKQNSEISEIDSQIELNVRASIP